MFNTLARKITRDKDLPERTWTLQVLRSVLEGTLYDKLKHSFQDERTESNEYIPLRDRRPSVRYNLCRMVVQDSVALLFGDGHFPMVELPGSTDVEILQDIVKEAKLSQVMHEAAIRGSIGSVAILMRVLSGRVFCDVMDTDYLTPTYKPEEPDTLLSVMERYKVKGRDLRAIGYAIDDKAMERDFWFQRIWDDNAENWFTPVPVHSEIYEGPFKGKVIVETVEPEIDKARSVVHALGFVPLVWIKNLSAKGLDGCCTFRPAVDTQIEIEYQLSQAGRGLKYSADPLLMIREPVAEGSAMVRSAGTALVVSTDGDAKMLEINGAASAAVIEYVRVLRESAIESIHGNRSTADKVSVAQSGRALEMMHQALIALADQLRTSYGENGLLPLVRMIVQAAQKLPIKIRGKQVKPPANTDDFTLRWPPWFAPTGQDRNQEAQTLATLGGSGYISRETAVKSLAAQYDIEDVAGELARISKDEDEAFARAAKADAQVKANDNLPS